MPWPWAAPAARLMFSSMSTVSIVDVYWRDDRSVPDDDVVRQIQMRMGQANVKRWVDDNLPLLSEDDPLGVESCATHHVSLHAAAHADEMFQTK